MNITIIANMISLLGAIVMVGIDLIKENKHVLEVQCLQFTLMGIANFMLKATSGGISNIVGILRNLYSLKKPMETPVKIGFIVLQVAISLLAGMNGLIGWLPIIATVIFTIFVDTKNPYVMKGVIVFTVGLWFIYDMHFHNYTASLFDIMTIVSNTFTAIKMYFSRQQAASFFH